MPFDLLDPITADAPSRTISSVEDVRFQNANAAAQIVERPKVELDDPSVVGSDLIILHSGLGECLAPALVDLDATPVGRVTASTLSVGAPSASTSGSTTSSIYRSPRGSTVVVAHIAPERSVAWISAVFAALKPASVFVICGIAGYSFRGTIDAESTNDNIFCLHTNKLVDKNTSIGSVAPLPNANLIDGLGAAAMLQAECDGLPASAIIAVELTRSPREELACGVGHALLSLLENRPLSTEELSAIKRTCAVKYSASADLSVYA